MPTYRYQPGDRPLDGYTVRAAAGRGGFGEVYFAQSDAGREVALKALYATQGYDQIELRGVQHCMNLKSPHLVSIFDVKTGRGGEPFVIMEYVSGPSLRDLLNDAPGGLGTDKAAFFLREVAKGLSHLHGYGVVHRDLKPANIFYEDSYVKIGDYGLSKLMSADAAASQTVTVGTVHYMAPEIGAGKYDKSIDLYALGCLLYEMLTGRVPYAGASPSEVLMKHLQAEPDLRDVPEHFARVIRKALQKDPGDRYATAAEMVEDLFGAEHVRDSVSHLNADALSQYAARVGRRVEATPTPRPAAPPTPAARTIPKREARSAERTFGHPACLPNLNFAVSIFEPAPSDRDTINRRWPDRPGGVFLAISAGLAGVATLLSPQIGGRAHGEPFNLFLFLLICGAAAAWNLSRIRNNRIPPSPAGQLGARMRPLLRTAVVVVPLLMLIASNAHTPLFVDALIGSALILAGVILAIHWPPHLQPTRSHPLNLALWLGLGGLGALAAVFFGTPPLFAFTLAVTAALGAQLLSPPAETTTDAAAVLPAAHAFTASTATTLPPAVLGITPTTSDAATASATHGDASRHSRLAALLLCVAFCVFPLGGLHRFYTGRWITGLLYLVTFGFFGIGQLIDAVVLATGAFRDASDRPVSRWRMAPDTPRTSSPGTASAVYRNRTWTPAIDGRRSPLAMGLHLAGVLVLLLGLALMVPVWFSLPELVGTLPAFATWRADVGQALGYDAWPRLLGRGLFSLGLAGLIAGTLVVVVARRGGTLHGLRALLGGAILCIGAIVTAEAPASRAVWPKRVDAAIQNLPASDRANPLANLDLILGEAFNTQTLVGLFWLAAAGVLFAIPARVRPTAHASTEPRP